MCTVRGHTQLGNSGLSLHLGISLYDFLLPELEGRLPEGAPFGSFTGLVLPVGERGFSKLCGHYIYIVIVSLGIAPPLWGSCPSW